jgi:pimeloyl-ACP methyl ester carboxylesterase
MKTTETLHRPIGSRKKSLRDRLQQGSEVPSRNGYFRSFDGTKLFYSVEGEGKPIIFCYGLVCSSLHWTYQIEHFRKNYKTIWMDYRGHQNSEIPADLSSLTLESLATFL